MRPICHIYSTVRQRGIILLTLMLSVLNFSYGQTAAPDTILAVEDMNIDQVITLEHFLKLPPSRLQRMRETIKSIEDMPEEEKQGLRQQIETYKTLHKQLQVRMDQKAFVPPGHRMLIVRHLVRFPSEKRHKELQRICKMDAEKRTVLLRKFSSQYRLEARQPKVQASAPDAVSVEAAAVQE